MYLYNKKCLRYLTNVIKVHLFTASKHIILLAMTERCTLPSISPTPRYTYFTTFTT